MPDKDDVFEEAVSPSLVRLDTGASVDDFMTIIRYAQPDDEDAAEAWRQERPIALLRVRDKNASVAEPYPAPVYDPKTARSERGSLTMCRPWWRRSSSNGGSPVRLSARSLACHYQWT